MSKQVNMCTVMSFRSLITVIGPRSVDLGAGFKEAVLRAITSLKVKAKDPKGAEVEGPWQELLVEIATMTKSAFTGPTIKKDLEQGNVYRYAMTVGGMLSTSHNTNGRLMTVRAGPLYDTDHYHVSGEVDIDKMDGFRASITLSVATVKRERQMCEAGIGEYHVLPIKSKNPPRTTGNTAGPSG